MSSIKCFDLVLKRYNDTRYVPFLAPTSFLWRRRRHTCSCLFLNENHKLSRSPLRQIDLCRQCLHALVWSTPRAGFGQRLLTRLTNEPTYMHQLLLPKLVKVTSGGIFVKEFCYTSGSHGSIWENFCSPSKTTKRVQISIGLPERASKNAATERTSFLRER